MPPRLLVEHAEREEDDDDGDDGFRAFLNSDNESESPMPVSRTALDAASLPEPDAETPCGPASLEEGRFQRAFPLPTRHIWRLPAVPAVAKSLQEQDIPEGALGIISDEACNSDSGRAGKRAERHRDLRLWERDLKLPVKRARMVLRKTTVAYSETLLEREIFREVIEEDHYRWKGCIALPISVIFFVFYLISVIYHESVTFTHITTMPMRRALQSALQDVISPDDVYGFLQNTYLPFFFAQYDGRGNHLPQDRWSIVGQYTVLLGAAQMELQRGRREPCPALADFVECYPLGELTGEAFGRDPSLLPPPIVSRRGTPWSLEGNWTWWDWGASSKSTSAANRSTILECAEEGFSAPGCSGSGARRLLDVRYEVVDTLPASSGGAPTYKFHLDSRTPYAQLYNRIEYLKARRWLDEQSSTLVLKAVLLNSQFGGCPRIVSVNVYFFFSRGGGVYTDLRVEGKALEMFSDKMSYIADSCFVCILVIRTLSLIRQFWRSCRKKDRSMILNSTFFFACFTVFFSYLNIGFMFIQESMLRLVKKNMEAYFSDPTAALSSVLYASCSDVYWLAGYTRPLVAYANFFFLCQVIIALQWQPRLAVVTQTLVACCFDLFHYLIVLSLTVAAFALSGMVIFGRRVVEFADPVSAMGVCFKIAIENEYDWDALSSKEWMTSFAWVVLYFLLVVVLMVNMVLAIIMDVYAEVRVHAGHSMSIFEQLQYIYRRLKYRSSFMHHEELLDQVAEMPSNLTMREVRLAFPDMHLYQLQYFQAQCKNKAERILRVGLNKKFLTQTVAATVLGMEEIEVNLRTLKHRGWMANGIEVGSDHARPWVKNVFASIASQNLWLKCVSKQLTSLQLRVQGLSPADQEGRRKKQVMCVGPNVRMQDCMVDFGQIPEPADHWSNTEGFFGM